MPILKVVLTRAEKDALDRLAEQEFRSREGQAAIIIRRALEGHGVLGGGWEDAQSRQNREMAHETA